MTATDILRIRIAAWAGVAVLPIAYVVIASTGMTVAEKVMWTDTVVYLVPIALLFIVCFRLAAQSQVRVEHWLWGALTIGSALTLAGECYFTWYVFKVDFHGPPLASPLRLVYAIITVMFVVLILRMSTLFEEPVAVRVRVIADFAGILVCAYALVYALWMLPSFAGLPDRAFQAANAAMFPVLGTALFVAAISTISGWRLSEWRMWERLIAVAYAIYAAGLLAFGEWYPLLLRSTEQTLSPYIIVMGSGMYLAFLAGVYRITDEESDAVVEMYRAEHRRGRVSRMIPALLTAALPLVVWLSRTIGDRAAALPLAVSAVALAVLLAGRSWVSALDLASHRLRAVTDPLTGVYNSSYLRRRLRDILRWAADGDYPVSVAVFDIDMFRSINNSYGHRAGDLVLQRVAATLNHGSPVGSEIFRFGSDDFVVLMPYATAETAVACASKVRRLCYRGASPNEVTPVGVSAGIATYPQHGTDARTLLEAARSAERSTHASNSAGVMVYDSDTMDAMPSDGLIEDLRSRAFRDTVRALAAAVDARDPATRDHSGRVSELAVALANRLGLDAEKAELIGMAAQMHDVGKIGIPDDVLLKVGPLTPEEREVVEAHCDLGVRILESANMQDILPTVRHHHERWDGKGYPGRLKGHDIPLESRILAVCDTYETLVSGRPYKPAMDRDAVVRELQSCSGTQFDPMVVATFLLMISEEQHPVAAPHHAVALGMGDPEPSPAA